jgi:hypothetical protein
VFQKKLGGLGHRVRPLPLALAGVEQSGVVDSHACCGGQCDKDGLVLVAELLRSLLLRHVKVAEDLVTDADRRAQEGVHRRMLGWEPVRVGVLGDVLEATRLRVADKQPQDAVPAGRVADLRPLLRRHPAGDKLNEPLAVRTNDP